MPIIKSTNNNIKQTSTRVYTACKKGYTNAQIQSKKYNHSNVKKAYNISKGITKELYKSSSINDLPYIAAAIGFLTPLPLASPIMLIIGKILQLIVKKLHKP